MGPDRSPATKDKSFEQHSDMTTLSALKRLQLELAEARQALVEAERQRQQGRQRADEAEQERQYEVIEFIACGRVYGVWLGLWRVGRVYGVWSGLWRVVGLIACGRAYGV
jgi:hypothetical protein